jgi:hypothetical protein
MRSIQTRAKRKTRRSRWMDHFLALVDRVAATLGGSSSTTAAAGVGAALRVDVREGSFDAVDDADGALALLDVVEGGGMAGVTGEFSCSRERKKTGIYT